MSGRWVVLDCDGVLCDPYPAILSIAKERHGAPEMTVNDIHCYDFLSYGMGVVPDDEFWRAVWTSDLIREMPWARQTVKRLRELGFMTALVTHRPSHEGRLQAEGFGKSIGVDAVYATATRGEKAAVAISLRAVAALEDHPTTAADLGELVGSSFLLTKPWNWFCVDVRNRYRRVRSLAEFTMEMAEIARRMNE